MKAEDKLVENGYDNVVYLTNYSYDDALIGCTHDGRAVYDYDKMVEWLMKEDPEWTCEDCIEWIDYNTIRALSYTDNDGPIILYRFPEE